MHSQAEGSHGIKTAYQFPRRFRPGEVIPFGNVSIEYYTAAQMVILQRWGAAGRPALQEFVPYFKHVFSVDLFFHLALAADLISRVRPAGKADNKVDISYLYYLPFCRVFTSSDNLHERVVPLFLRDDQSFVKGPELRGRSFGNWMSTTRPFRKT